MNPRASQEKRAARLKNLAAIGAILMTFVVVALALQGGDILSAILVAVVVSGLLIWAYYGKRITLYFHDRKHRR